MRQLPWNSKLDVAGHIQLVSAAINSARSPILMDSGTPKAFS